ncbi:uncharacterized protein [Triticum aestivum]|uniref:uncharacterized protein isoform X1 n=1 Tax=Triticum aestivum TaxID=4565 RepID=UPI0008435E48|nr:uncharacterized protein LOC123092668 isoform X1 [Triticum aestivum]
MDPAEVLNVRFHFGGEFIRIGPSLDYVGGETRMSEIERDKLSLPELKGFLGDHMIVKESMKFHFLLPGRELINGLLFLFDDAGCMKMSDCITDGGVAEVYVEYNGEEDEPEEADSGSDFEGDELEDLMCIGSEEEPDLVITAGDEHDNGNEQSGGARGEILEHIVVPNKDGVITQVISSPLKKNVRSGCASQCSQVVNPTQAYETANDLSQVSEVAQNAAVVARHAAVVPQNATTVSENAAVVSENTAEVGQDVADSSDSEDIEYVPHTDDSGEESEVIELRKHARKFRKKMRDSKRWADTDSTGAVPIELVANVEETVHDMEFESSDEDYSYDEDEDGNMVRRKSKYIRFNPESDIPHFSLGMVFRSKKQLTKAIKRYGLATKRSISFLKSEEHRVRAKCDWPGCPWLLYAAKTSRCHARRRSTYTTQKSSVPTTPI